MFRRVHLAFAATLVMLFAATPTALADTTKIRILDTIPTPLYPGVLVDGPVQEAALAAQAVDERANGLTTAVVTHSVYARIAGDEEWRASYGTSWTSEANYRLEAADDQMFLNWGIDFVSQEYVNWDNNDGSAAVCDFMSEFMNEISLNGKDVAVGFMKNPTSDQAGCASGNYVLVKYQSSSVDWKVTQHEFSHLYGDDDVAYGDPTHPVHDVMDDLYNHPNTWCTTNGWWHSQLILGNASKYD